MSKIWYGSAWPNLLDLHRHEILERITAPFSSSMSWGVDNQAEEVLKQPGPVLVCVKTIPDIRGPRQPSGPVNTEVVQGRPQAIDNLLKEFGR